MSTGQWSGLCCLYASDERKRVRRIPREPHLPECIRPRHTVPKSGYMGWRDISYNSRLDLVFLQGKINVSAYIAQVVNPILLSFLRQDGYVLFEQESASPHTAAGTQRALWCVRQLP